MARAGADSPVLFMVILESELRDSTNEAQGDNEITSIVLVTQFEVSCASGFDHQICSESSQRIFASI